MTNPVEGAVAAADHHPDAEERAMSLEAAIELALVVLDEGPEGATATPNRPGMLHGPRATGHGLRRCVADAGAETIHPLRMTEGETDREIAEALFIRTRICTASGDVAGLPATLGIESRTAAALAVGRGLV